MNEAVAVASEMWSELKRYVNTVDRDEAAETVVAILIDNDKSYEDEDEEDVEEEEDHRADDWEN